MADKNDMHLTDKEKQLKEELEEFRKEQARLKKIIGNFGGKKYSKIDTIVNVSFLIIILFLFVLEITTHWLPPNISLEVGILLVSIKIVWMIHSQHKFNHFQFWVLNTIEFRISELYKKVKKIEKDILDISGGDIDERKQR